jgi:DNA invertase Pin-like site-specific DNA recombinase
MGRAMFTIIGAMAELESSLISERATAGMDAARVRGKRIGKPPLAPPVVGRTEALAATTGLAVRQIQKEIAGRASRGFVGEITKRVRASQPNAL